MNLRQKLLQKKDHRRTHLHVTPEGEHVLFVMPSERVMVDLQDRHGGQPTLEYETELLMACCYEPVWVQPEGDKNNPTPDKEIGRDEDGHPVIGKLVFEKGDKEDLMGPHHEIGGWLRQLKDALTMFIKEVTVELKAKTAAAGKSTSGES